MNKIKIFIATEPGHEKAEKALEWSIINSTSGEFEIFWMDDGSGTFSGWNKGRLHNKQNSGEGWKTNFSCYRWAIPELCDFSGKAIYLDVDQIVLKDIRQMWDLDLQNKAVLTIRPEKTDVMIMDCSKFSGSWWPRLSQMKDSGKSQKHYRVLVESLNLIGQMSEIYNNLDGEGFSEETRLVHYTKMNTQPWHPFPENLTYKTHKNFFIEKMWHDFYAKALEYEKEHGVILGS